MIQKETFLNMTDADAIKYVSEHYCIDDVNDICEDDIMSECEDEDEYEDMTEDKQPFEVITEDLSGNELKDYLWDNIVCVCEELDEDAEEVAEDERGEF